MDKKIAVLGPQGTYSEEAFMLYKSLANLEDYKPHFCNFIGDVFREVSQNKATIGIVPIENLLNGSVVQTLDKLHEYNLNVIDEVYLRIKHCLLSKSTCIENIKVIKSHPQAIEQCSKFIEYLKKEVMPVSSSAKAAEEAANNPEIGAIASPLNSKTYNLNILAEDIGDEKNNFTRFFIISKLKEGLIKGVLKKTSILINPKADYPGLLSDILSVFRLLNINLTRIESRPTKKKFGEYMFYIDLEISQEEKDFKLAIELLKKKIGSEVRVFGTYTNFLKERF